MQLIDNNNRLTFGKYKGSLANLVPATWTSWAIANVPQFKEQYEAYKPRFKKLIGNQTMIAYKPRRKTFTSRAKRPKKY
jgi:hypothetical protein